MAGERKMAGETDKTVREAERDTEMSVLHRQAAQVLGRRALLAVHTPVKCFMYYRYDVKQTSDVFVLFWVFFPRFPNGKMIH